MPIFHTGMGDPTSLVSEQSLEQEHPVNEVMAGIEEMRSNTPEDRGISLTTTDGRPISRGEVIERLKRGESPTWTIKRNISPIQTSPPKNIPLKSPPVLQPSPDFSGPYRQDTLDEQRNAAGLELERPRSALHSGDFRPEREANPQFETVTSPLSVSPPAPWHTFNSSFPPTGSYDSRRSSGLSNMVLLPPTSPLINALSNQDIDNAFTRQRSQSPDKRRYSFSIHSLQTPRSISGSPITPRTSGVYHPYQAHQPRRSISIPQTPRVRPRGASISSEHSPLHNAPMVGSFEESIIRGRMSSIPSKPLNFIAQIGALGKGKCKPSLRCPPHKTINFPAVFYNYGGDNDISNNQPSPYVGHIDIEHSLKNMGDKAPPDGSYRIPAAGQLQIVIKNPNKTAVKLFLVPYDIRDMQEGQKTLLRQRSYSAGPIVDMPLTSAAVGGGVAPQSLPGKPILRYMIQLNICCTGAGRFYLYKSIRVVFANRVPDGKERLQNENQFPEPKYSPYRPTRDSVASSPQPSLSNALSTLDPAVRRRSTPISFGISNLDQADGITSSPRTGLGLQFPMPALPRLTPVPFGLQSLNDMTHSPTTSGPMDVEGGQPRTGPWVVDPNEGVQLTDDLDTGAMEWSQDTLAENH